MPDSHQPFSGIGGIGAGNKKVDKLDFEKTVAFQLGQSLSLIYTKDIYTKEDIAIMFPELYALLFRCNSAYNMTTLEFFKESFVKYGKKLIPKMEKLRE